MENSVGSQYYQALTEELRDRIMDYNSFSLQVKNGIPSKEESVTVLVQVYKMLTLEEDRI